MAIIIPSKSIYRQNNPKVRDNVVDNIEFETVNINPENQYGIIVAKQEIKTAEKTYNDFGEYIFKSTDFPAPQYKKITGYYTTVKFQYWEFEFIFAKELINSSISKVYEWSKNKEGSFTKYSLVGEISKQNKKATWNYNKKVTNIETTSDLTTSALQYITLPNVENSTFDGKYMGKSYSDDTSIVILEYGKDYYKAKCKILANIEYDHLKGEKTIPNLSDNETMEIIGEYTKYNISEIQLSFYGDTIGISIENDTIKFKVGNNNHLVTIEGNELTQTTNYYETEDNLLLEKQAENILDAYKNGKETATIRCSIVDYYDENGDLAISTSGENLLNADKYTAIYNATYENGVVTQNNSTGNREFKFDLDGINDKGNILSKPISLTQTIYGDRTLYFEFKKTSEFDKILFSRGEAVSTSIEYDVSHLINDEVYTFSVKVEVDVDKCKWAEMQIYKGQEIKEYEPFYPMCFQQYDEVIPMDYAVVNGKTQDVPMSTYKDGTPKQFQVLSTNIEYDGSVMQILELQEILQKQQPIFSRVYTVEFLLDNYVYARKTTVDGKVYELPDAPSISAGYYFDAWYTEPNGGGEKVTTDTTFKKDTKVYANVVEDMAYTVDVTFYDTVKGIETITTGLGGYLNAVPAPKSKKYYVFAGYATLQNGEGIRVTKQYKFTEDTNLYPYYVEEPTASLFDEVYKNINQNAKDIQELDNKIEGIINPDNPDTDETIYQDFVSYGDQEDNSVSGFGATGLDTSALEEYLSTATPVDGNSYEINIKPTVTNEFGSEATVEVIHSYAFADYSDILGEKQLTYVIPTTVTAFGYKAFDLTNASIVFLGDNNQFEEILANSATQWCSVGGSGGNSGTGSYGKDVTVKFGGINGASFNYFVPFTEEP